MDLELGTVVQCDQAGCSVRLVKSGETIHAAFSPLVKDCIRIRRQQLVAIDRDGPTAEIAWRWFRGVVEGVDADGVSVRRLDLAPGACRVVALDPHGFVGRPGDEVYYGHHDTWAVVDTVRGDGPAHPEAIAERYFDSVKEQLTA